MTPSRSRAPGYRPPRARRELVTAVLGVLAVVAFTAIMVWVLGPHPDSGSGGGSGGGGTPAVESPSTTLGATPTTTVAPG
jgi:predicted metal-binding membrane protein